MIVQEIFEDLIGKTIEITEDVENVYCGGFVPEIHDSTNCSDCKNNCCQYQVEDPWIKLGYCTLLAGEQHYVEGFNNNTSVRLLLLPERKITADLDLEKITSIRFFKVLP